MKKVHREVKYRVLQLIPGQAWFGAGDWIVERVVTETILAAPSRAAAEEIMRKLKRSDREADDGADD